MSAARVVVALGGNALLRRGEPAEAETQRRNVLEAASALAAVAAIMSSWSRTATARRSGCSRSRPTRTRRVSPYPLDVLGAESQGMIGYLLVQALRTSFPDREVVARPDAGHRRSRGSGVPHGRRNRSARCTPSVKPARWRATTTGRSPPTALYFRRVVPSPRAERIVELESIEPSLASGAVVVCAGGGGIPVVRGNSHSRGVEAVIDKDLTAALLAEALGAERLVLATDVHYRRARLAHGGGRRRSSPRPERPSTLAFAAGSMGPKVEAACRFVERTGGTAAIGALSELGALVRGDAGTQIASARVATRATV